MDFSSHIFSLHLMQTIGRKSIDQLFIAVGNKSKNNNNTIPPCVPEIWRDITSIPCVSGIWTGFTWLLQWSCQFQAVSEQHLNLLLTFLKVIRYDTNIIIWLLLPKVQSKSLIHSLSFSILFSDFLFVFKKEWLLLSSLFCTGSLFLFFFFSFL